MARLVPVLDILCGRVVRAVGGRRGEYRSLASPLSGTADPVPTARALLAATGATELYVADLDAITGPAPILSPNWEVVGRLAELPATVWLDYGHRDDFDEAEALGAGVTHFVLGTETLGGVDTVYHTWAMYRDCGEVMVSLDLKAGVLQCSWATDLIDALKQAAGCFSRVLVLDVAAVGERTGPTTGPLCRRVRDAFPDVEVWTGGGIRNRDDVQRLADAGADAVLVASALHDGTLP